MDNHTNYAGLEAKDQKTYLRILNSDGSIRTTVPEGTQGAVARAWEAPDGSKGTKHELVFSRLSGLITDIKFIDGDYGQNLVLEFTNDGNSVYLSLGVSSPFAEDVMKKLPNVDLKQEVTLAPYAFEDERGKSKKGVTLYQGGTEPENKIANFFQEWDKEKKEFIYKNNYPKPKGDTKAYTKSHWQQYFLSCRIFLVEYTQQNILTQFEGVEKKEDVDDVAF
jgi:hypothetical protein